MTAVISILIALGSIAGLVLWILRRYGTSSYKAQKLKEKADAITSEIIRLEKRRAADPTFDAGRRIADLYGELSAVNRKIRAIRENKPKGILG